MYDTTVAMDDALVERFLICLVCGSTRQGQRTLDLVQVGAQTLAVARCLRCCAQDPAAVQLIAQLEKRERT